MSQYSTIFTPLALAAALVGCKRAPDTGPVHHAPIAELVARSEWPPGEARGLSGLASDGRGRFFAVPERTRRLLVFTATSAPVLRSSTTAIEGIPDGTDLESLAWIGTSSSGESFVAGTESQLADRETDVLYLGNLARGTLTFTPAFELAYAPFALRAEVNRGLEGLCVAGGVLIAAAETVGTDEKGRRFAPIAALSLPAVLPSPAAPAALARPEAPALVRGPWHTARLWLTTDRGKISALSCRTGPKGSIEVLAIERHYELSRILAFTWPPTAAASGGPTDITPELWLDLAPPFGTEVPNFEGLERVSDSEVVLVADNDFGRALGPTIAVRVRRPPR
ncbi:esterase-like activity of phytase family protein [Myxococcota bacterium]|nr:esterase-like activity of phytase family protein [Myxococcota bacterium]